MTRSFRLDEKPVSMISWLILRIFIFAENFVSNPIISSDAWTPAVW